MTDPRFNGDHLGQTRCDLFQHARQDLLEACGPLTQAAEEAGEARPAHPGLPAANSENANATYLLVNLEDGCRFALHVGLNAVGRWPENDIVLDKNAVSRRHCVFLVHSDGSCEVHDTASRNGTLVNGNRVSHTRLAPGDVIWISNLRFVLRCEGWSKPETGLGPTAETACFRDYDSTCPSGG
ncbi:MAG: FHA domain-containing protein [Planctomycetes bacterium]|nr:FHA domain-containing protein [Planctomycetota bacterium]